MYAMCCSAGRDRLSHSRVPSESSSSRVGSTRGRGLGDLKVRNGKGRLSNTAIERKVSSTGAGTYIAPLLVCRHSTAINLCSFVFGMHVLHTYVP